MFSYQGKLSLEIYWVKIIGEFPGWISLFEIKIYCLILSENLKLILNCTHVLKKKRFLEIGISLKNDI